MPRAGLTPGAIVEIALGAVDENGLAGLTLTTVAERAGGQWTYPNRGGGLRVEGELADLIGWLAVENPTWS